MPLDMAQGEPPCAAPHRVPIQEGLRISDLEFRISLARRYFRTAPPERVNLAKTLLAGNLRVWRGGHTGDAGMKLSEVVQELIRLGDASQAYWDTELPRHHPHYPVILAEERPAPPPPEDAHIQALLKSLPEDQRYAVTLLSYMGRGDFTADRFIPAYRTIKEILPSKELAIAQVTGQKALGEYLTDAMAEIQKRHINLDSLTFPSAVAVS
jgi:Protein of unknown function (DUF3775)